MSLLTSLISFSSSVVFFLESLNCRTWRLTLIHSLWKQFFVMYINLYYLVKSSNLHVDVLLCSYASGLKMALCLLQLVSDQLLDGIFLIFVYKLLDGFSHALFSQQGELHLLWRQNHHKQLIKKKKIQFYYYVRTCKVPAQLPQSTV